MCKELNVHAVCFSSVCLLGVLQHSCLIMNHHMIFCQALEHLPLSDSRLCGHCGIGMPGASPPCAKNPREGIQNPWRTVLHRDEGFVVKSHAVDSSRCGVWRGSRPRAESQCHPAARPYPPPQYKPMGCCQVGCSEPMSQCSVCYGDLLWEQRLNHSAPSVYSPVRIGKKRCGTCFQKRFLLKT